VCHLRDRPSEGGIVERPFKTFNTELFSTLPGYTGSNVQERPEEAEKDARLTLKQLEQILVRYIVDNYNQRIDARMGDQTRFQRWDAGLRIAPDVISERELDICLMKQTRRSIQRGGYLQFENLMYRGEYLAGYAGENVVLRYDPRDITSVLIYRQEGSKEVFLSRAHAQDLETEELSLDEAKASSRRIREAGKTLSNRSILAEVRDLRFAAALRYRDTFGTRKKSKKERRKEEQAQVRVQAKQDEPLELDEVEVAPIEAEPELEMAEVFDYEQLREDYGW
jgi:putative transposase